MIQTRRDVLAAEQIHRSSGPFATPLAEVISGQKQGVGRGEAVRLTLPAEEMAAAEAQVEAILGDLALVLPKNLDDRALADTVHALDEEERRVSADRAAAIEVNDRLQDELKDRYRHDPSQIPKEI